MEREINSGTMLGIVLIALAAVIGLGFGVFSIAKGVANEGTVNVQTGLEAAQNSIFDMYDKQVVTGTQLLGLQREIIGKPVAVLVKTKALENGIPTNNRNSEDILYIQNIEEENYINYNAILSNGEIEVISITGGESVTEGNGGVVERKSGELITNEFFLTSDVGKLIFNSVTEGMYKTGNSEYIGATTKYDSELIRDLAGTVVGVKFSQIE